MNKTKIRVLSMVVTVFMLVSMLTVFAVADAAPFATAYECAITVEGVPQIAKTALLVDTTITEDNGAEVVRNWDGNDYTFVVGTNAFKTLADAYAYATAKSIVCPDIIVTGWDGSDLVIEAESNVYAPNWNTAPMNEMGDMTKVGVKSEGEDWTANETYAAREIAIASIIVKGSPSNWVGVHGFTITKYITLGSERAVGAPFIEYFINNCKMDGVKTDKNTLTAYNNSDVNCQDVLTFKNFWLNKIDGTSTSASRFFGDGVLHTPHIVFDGLYIDFSKSDLGFAKTNDHIKTKFSNSSLVFKNSNLRRSGTGSSPYWNIAQNTASVVTRELIYDNCTLYDTNQAGGFIYFFDGGYSKVHVTNNFVITTPTNSKTTMPLFHTNGSDQGVVGASTYKITGNKLLGINPEIDAKFSTKVPMFVEDNFTVSTVMETLDEYKAADGEPIVVSKGFSPDCSGSYIYNYDMMYSSKIKVTDVDFGPDSEVEIGADSISIKCLGEATVVTPKFTANPDSAALGVAAFKLSNDINFNDTVETVDVAKIAENKTATLYLKAYYPETEYETVYQIKIIAATPIDFNDPFMENGFEFAGKNFVFENTAVFVKETELEDDGFYYGYGFLGEEYYRFKVDNSIVFDDMSLLKIQMTGVIDPNVLLPGGEYGELTFNYAANYYGTNAGINPVDKSQAQNENDFDWDLNEKWAEYSDTAIDAIYFADGLEGKIYLDGITVRGQVNDTLRTMGKDGVIYDNLDIEFNNLVVQHIRAAEFVDVRNGGIAYKGIGSTTADKIFNLINSRSVNSNDTQVEYIEGQYMDIDYFDFSDSYAETFTLKNAYISNMRNAKRLFNDYVPSDVVIDNLYIDGQAVGDKIDGAIGYFKTGAANKTGSFTLINSNIRNGGDSTENAALSFEGPRGEGVQHKLAEGIAYDVIINNNIIVNAIPANAEAETIVAVAPSMLSSLEIKNNTVLQTGDNAAKKAFIKHISGIAELDNHNSDADLAIIGNIDVDNNSFVGFDDADLKFDIALGENNPTIKNTFASAVDNAHLVQELIGIYATSMRKELYYLDFARTVSSANALITEVTSESEDLRNINHDGQTVTLRIYGGTLADLDFISNAGKNTGYWATNSSGSKTLDAETVTPEEIGVGRQKNYYYIYTYTYNEVDYKYSYKVTVVSSVDCTTHNWETSGTYNNDATCQQDGTQLVECKNTGCFETMVIDMPNSKSNCVFENYVGNNNATCMSVGTETGECKWCGEKNTRENATLYPISKTAHNWGEWTYNNDATCCKDGTETRVCDYACGAYQTQTSAEHLKSTVAHTWGEYTYDGTATCTKNGTKTAMCTVEGCRATNTIEDPNFPASDKNHVWGEYVYNKDATTLADGTKTATCSICGEKNTVKAEGTKLAVTIEDSSKTFKDVKSAWYKTAVDYVTSHGFVSGTSKTEFGVGTNVDRAMFVTILARMAGVDTSTEANKAATTKFDDVAKGKYYTAAVKWANENSIVSGTGDKTFSPTAAISRQDLCVMVVNFAKYMNISLVAKQKEITFTDANKISNYAKDAVKTCQMAGIISGHTSGAFGPRDTATREQASQIIYTLHSNFMA